MTKDLMGNNTVGNYDRVLKCPAKGVADTTVKFKLENGYYVNQAEKIFIKSTNETGKFFTKINGESR